MLLLSPSILALTKQKLNRPYRKKRRFASRKLEAKFMCFLEPANHPWQGLT